MPAGTVPQLGVFFSVPSLGMMDSRTIDRDRFYPEFAGWLIDRLDWLYYVLSK